MIHELMVISEFGDISILGVYLGMHKNIAKRILTPSTPEYGSFCRFKKTWKLIESDYFLKISDYYIDEKIIIIFYLKNDLINRIYISRSGEKEKRVNDTKLKYFFNKLKDSKVVSKTTKKIHYNTGLYYVDLFIGSPDDINILNHRINEYYFNINIKYEDITNKIYSKKENVDTNEYVGCLLFLVSFITGGVLFFNINDIVDFFSTESINVTYITLVFILFILSVSYFILRHNNEDWKNKNIKLRDEAISFYKNIKESYIFRETEIRQEIERYETSIKQSNEVWVKQQEELYLQKKNQLLSESKMLKTKKDVFDNMVKDSLFKRSASLYADYKVLELDAIEIYLRTKKNPIREGSSTSEILKQLKIQIREHIAMYKEMLYKWEYLMNLFPELSKYIDDDNDIQDLENYDGLDDFKENYDKARDYLTEDEYRSLSEDERNQRALDVWKRMRKPSKWIAGIEYEMYCAYILRKNGYSVIEHGIQKGLNDLGIDLIAKRNNTTYIIQCKRYSTAPVHENTICQLFGTTIKYKIDNEGLFKMDIVPLLLTTGKLTDTAKEFADRLGVKYKEVQMGEYPMIKCNINNGNKIYHLPFDQQYWRTVIDKPGEFYAMTVKEATSKGFRRAFKHMFK